MLSSHQQNVPQNSAKGPKHTNNKMLSNQRSTNSKGVFPQRTNGSKTSHYEEPDSAVVTENESFFDDNSPPKNSEKEAQKRMTKKYRPERGIRDLKAYT